jgi:hypothetical protein
MPSPAPHGKIRYDGTACLNVRSITDALDVLSAPASYGKPLPRSDLFTVLWFVDTAVMSPGMYFDGTVPRDTINKANDAVGRFQQRHELWDFSVTPIIPGAPEEILEHAGTAACQCLPLLREFELVGQADKAVQPEEAKAFLAALTDDVAESRLETRALELVADAFRGSKLIAGLLKAGPDALAAAREAFRRYPDQTEIVVGGLINRFRLNYLNQLASSVRGAYQPDLQFEPMSKQHVRLFKDYVVPMLVKRSPEFDVPNLLAENLRQDVPLPSIGLYSLMITKETGRPVAILETALNRFAKFRSLRRRLSDPTEQALNSRNRGALDESLGQIDELFKSEFRQMELEAQGIKKLSGPRKAATYIIPAVLSAVAGTVSGAVGAAAVVYKVLVSAAAGATAKSLGDRFLNLGVNSYISEYTAFKWDLQEDPELRQPLARVADQVAQVFGRPLV